MFAFVDAINGNAAYTSNANLAYNIGGGNFGQEIYNGNFSFNMPAFTNLKIAVTDDVLFNGDVKINNGVDGFTLNDGPKKMIFRGNAVKLNWVTTDEKNVSHFDIERSSDGGVFTKSGL